MGMFTQLLLLPLAPVRGVRWIADVLGDEADRELARRESPERQLADLQASLANGEISPQEADTREAELVERILAGHGLSGGT
jgi:hypothetical protein